MSKTRCANTVPTSVAHAPLRRGVFRVRTATRASSPIRPGRTAFAKRPTQKAEKTSGSRGCGGSIAEWMTVVQARTRATTERRFSVIATTTHSHCTALNASPIAVRLPCLHQSSPATAARKSRPSDVRTRALEGQPQKEVRLARLCSTAASGHYRRRPGAPSFPPRPRDRPSRAAGARRARRRAAVRTRRHGDRRPPRPAADRGARPRRHRARRRVHDLQLPHVRHDRGRRSRLGCRATRTRAARLAAQALWASLGIGLALLAACEIVAAPLLAGARRPRTLGRLRARLLPDRRRSGYRRRSSPSPARATCAASRTSAGRSRSSSRRTSPTSCSSCSSSTASAGGSPARRRERQSRRPGWAPRSSSSCCGRTRLRGDRACGR